MSERKALVTLAVGASFRRRWREICQSNWSRYAERHGYDLICLDQPLDSSQRARSRSAAWQKCLVLGQPFSRTYDRLVWVDLDIVINPLAPDICAGVPRDKVGAVDEYSIPTPELHQQMLRKNYARWREQGVAYIRNQTAEEYYTVFGFERGFARVVQTGVLVLSPRHHRELLEDVYQRYDDKGPAWNYEMRPLSYELMRADCVHWLDPRFNYIWGIYEALHFPFLVDDVASPRRTECLQAARRETFFLHFAGSTQYMAAAAAAAAAPPEHPEPPAAVALPAADTRPATTVAVFLFNRPRSAATLLAALRRVQPRRLMVIADGPRPGQAGEAADCRATRAVFDAVDWQCELLSEFSDEHLGLKRRFDSGMDAVFAQCEEAIVLEDDCVPEPSFFRFCDEMLARYRDDERVMSISGNNFQFRRRRGAASYYFSRFAHVWGWATWKRAWRHYDREMRAWPWLRDGGWIESRFEAPHARQYWAHIFESNFRTQENWDYMWLLSSWRRDGLHILPNVNLVSNHGFDDAATHTRDPRSRFAFLLTAAMRFPLLHPTSIEVDADADAFTEEVMFSGTLRHAFERVRERLRRRRRRQR